MLINQKVVFLIQTDIDFYMAKIMTFELGPYLVKISLVGCSQTTLTRRGG